MQDKYTRFQKLMEDIHDLGKAAGVLSWDRSAYMPSGGAAARARQSATLAKVIHELETSDEMGELLENLDEWKHTLDPDSDEYGLIRLAQREYTRARATPSDLVSRMSETNGLATMAWQKARAENDFAAFLPHLEKVFALAREYAACFPHVAHPYDALLDRVEQGLTKTEVERIFNELKGPQSNLRHPNIVRVYYAGQADGLFYVAMDLVGGTTLEARLVQNPNAWEGATALSVIEQVGAALDYAHRRGLVHHNLKPSNIFVGNDGHVLISDFDGVPARAGESGHPLY